MLLSQAFCCTCLHALKGNLSYLLRFVGGCACSSPTFCIGVFWLTLRQHIIACPKLRPLYVLRTMAPCLQAQGALHVPSCILPKPLTLV